MIASTKKGWLSHYVRINQVDRPVRPTGDGVLRSRLSQSCLLISDGVVAKLIRPISILPPNNDGVLRSCLGSLPSQ
ncbi:hypothetical protein JCGZ_19348 [Jatropha curcas]|uniref:Uncharacterized protein n=1 Tax=Jatropha curcas TaxID=180498 RepID=A0A067KCM8_JATCU|nr:hypothetical protein JCGZ_19348 [Jatropha curcas]